MKCPDCFSNDYNIIDTDPLLMSCDDCHATHSTSWSTGFWIGYLKKENELLTVKCLICGKELKVTIEEFVIADVGINPIACPEHIERSYEIITNVGVNSNIISEHQDNDIRKYAENLEHLKIKR